MLVLVMSLFCTTCRAPVPLIVAVVHLIDVAALVFGAWSVIIHVQKESLAVYELGINVIVGKNDKKKSKPVIN